MAIIRVRSSGHMEFHVEDIPSWQGFEEIVDFFIENFGVRVISKADGAGERAWELQLDNIILRIVHDDMIGNYFFAELDDGDEVVGEMADRLEKRINRNKT